MGTETMQVSFKTDSKGFISQECPACEHRFKMRPGQGSPRPVAHCPFCKHSGEDCWLTTEQAEYLKAFAAREILGPALEKFDRAFKRLGSGSGGLITVKVTGHVEQPRVPPLPVESEDDMPAETTFTCCGETIRHDTGHHPVCCIICGADNLAGS